MSDIETTPKKWDPRQTVFLKHLCKTGNVAASCRKAKINRTLVYDWRAQDSTFAKAWDEALVISVEMLEEEARRRAQDGVLEPVFYLGKRAGAVRKYSDTLLIFLLKAHKPDKYRENYRHEHVGDGGGAIKVEEVNGAGERILSRIDSIAAKLGAGGNAEPDRSDAGG